MGTKEIIEQDILEQIAEENNLDIVETTSEWNGYPKNIQKALIGFNSMEQIDEIRKELNREEIETGYTTFLDRRDGWQLWYRGNYASEPMDLMAYYGDDCHVYTNETTWEDFYRDEIEECSEYYSEKGADIYFAWMTELKEIFNIIQSLNDDEFIYCDNNGNWMHEPLKKISMSDYEDGNHLVIGLVIDE